MVSAEDKVCPVCGTRYHAAATFCQRDGAPLGSFDEPEDPLLGQVLLGQFRVEEVLGAGGMGTVYRAHQESLERDVAIKVLHPELVQNPDAVRRFHREAKVATRLDHPNLVRVILFGELPDGSLYLVMEHVRGRPLGEAIAEGAMAPDRALHIAIQICEGIGEAHAHGVVHRDVKPDNLLLVRRGADPDFVKVLDFGIARILWGEQTVATQSGVIFGTARYISPEGASGEITDTRSDVYSIAVLTYQLLCGETPFDGPSPVALLMKHIHQPAPELRTRDRGRDVPVQVAEVVMAALSKNPDARPADARTFGEALRGAAAAAGLVLPGSGPRLSAPLAAPSAPSAPPPARVSARPSPSPAPAPAPTPTAPAPSTDSLARVSSPFRASGDDLSVAGLPTRAERPWGAMLLAFLLGVAAVTGGAFAVSHALGGPTAAEEVAALEASARAALEAGAYDSPPGDNVRDLTTRILDREPGNEGARAVRREAVLALRERAALAQTRGDLTAARADYRRALALAPEDETLREALDAVESGLAGSSPRGRGFRLTADPADPVAQQPVTLTGVLDVPAGSAAPTFRISRGARVVAELPAARGADGRTHVASHTFRRPGRYTVALQIPGDEAALQVRTELTVGASASASRALPPAPTTTQLGSGSPRSPMTPVANEGDDDDDGIDWAPPVLSPAVEPGEEPESGGDSGDDAPTGPPTGPPAPWTGGRVL